MNLPEDYQLLCMRIFDYCSPINGEHGDLNVLHPTDLIQFGWDKDVVKIYHTAGHCWQVVRHQNFKAGMPAGYSYTFEELGDPTGLGGAWELVKAALK